MSQAQDQIINAPSPSMAGPEDHAQRPLADMTPAQAMAFAILARGGSATLAAARAGVARSTLYRWLRQARPFHGSTAGYQVRLIATLRRRMLALADDATRVIQAAIHRGDTRAALKIVGRMEILAPSPSEPSPQALSAPNLPQDNPSSQRVTVVRAATRPFQRTCPADESR